MNFAYIYTYILHTDMHPLPHPPSHAFASLEFCHVVKCMCLCAEVFFFLLPHYSSRSIVWGSPFFSLFPFLMLCCNSSLNLVFPSCLPPCQMYVYMYGRVDCHFR